MARNQIAKKQVDGSTVTFAFSNGTNLTVDVGTLPSEIVGRLAVHGALQKIGDSYAGAESVADAVQSAQKVIDTLTAGSWGVERAVGESEGTLFNTVLARLLSISRGRETSVEEAAEVAKIKGEDWAKEVRKQPEYKKMVGEVQAERAAKSTKADLNTLLA